MPTQAAPRSAHKINATSDSQFNLLEMPWRAWGDPESFCNFYQLGYDAWRNWAETQLALLDACWKMSCLTLDMPGGAISTNKAADKSGDDNQSEVKLDRISNG
jgi:hypothetical protein